MTAGGLSPDFMLHLLVSVLAAGAIYGGIRADIKALHEQVGTALKSATRAHERIDNHLEKTP